MFSYVFLVFLCFPMVFPGFSMFSHSFQVIFDVFCFTKTPLGDFFLMMFFLLFRSFSYGFSRFFQCFPMVFQCS